MKKYFNKPFISLKQETYLSLIIFLAPCLYFLSGINLDIYSPSLPAISNYFHSSIMLAKNTIAMSCFGWGFGAFLFGILVDSIGRRKVLVIGIAIYLAASIAAVFSHTMNDLIAARFVQGFGLSSIVASRVLIVDLLTGERYAVAMLYTALGYGVGPILGPFFGGLLQHYFGWAANFFVLMLVSLFIFITLILYLKESDVVLHPLKIKSIAQRTGLVLKHKVFMCGVLIGAITQIQIMLYPTLGPFIVEKRLHDTVIVYGNSALLVGASYFSGSLLNRVMLKYFSIKAISDAGYIVLFISLGLSLYVSFFSKMDLVNVMLPIFLTGLSAGIIFPNVLSMNLKQFLNSTGVAIAVQSSILIMLTSFGLFFINYFRVMHLYQLSFILLILGVFETILYYGFYRRMFVQ